MMGVLIGGGRSFGSRAGGGAGAAGEIGLAIVAKNGTGCHSFNGNRRDAMNPDRYKEAAAAAALEQVADGMRLGIGTGSTAEAFIRLLARRCAAGLRIVGVPTSERTASLCRELGIPLTTLEETPQLDLTIDGADEIGPDLVLIKGGGGALLREKIVAAASDSMTVIADASKRVKTLGRFALPIEINRFGMRATMNAIERAAARSGLSGPVELRGRGGEPFVTDGGH